MTQPRDDARLVMFLTDAIARVVAAYESVLVCDTTEALALLTDLEYDLAGAMEQVMARA